MSDINTESTLQLSDPKVFEGFFKTHYAALCRSSFRIVNDRDAAEDIVQEVFLKLWNNRDNINITQSAKAYLFRSVINESLNYIKKYNRVISVEDLPNAEHIAADNQPDDSGNMKELSVNLNDAINTLAPKCKEVFLLSRYSDMSYKTIAEHLGISIKTVENQMGKALKILRKQLRNYLSVLSGIFF